MPNFTVEISILRALFGKHLVWSITWWQQLVLTPFGKYVRHHVVRLKQHLLSLLVYTF
jgi:hypothetical protein